MSLALVKAQPLGVRNVAWFSDFTGTGGTSVAITSHRANTGQLYFFGGMAVNETTGRVDTFTPSGADIGVALISGTDTDVRIVLNVTMPSASHFTNFQISSYPSGADGVVCIFQNNGGGSYTAAIREVVGGVPTDLDSVDASAYTLDSNQVWTIDLTTYSVDRAVSWQLDSFATLNGTAASHPANAAFGMIATHGAGAAASGLIIDQLEIYRS